MRNILFSAFIIITGIFQGSRPEHLLVIGDSNGASAIGWAVQLARLRKNSDKILNYSISGNTIGFDNLGQDTLNTLKNIDQYLKNAEDSLKVLDKILICLGTNDCKAVFDSVQKQIPENMERLILAIENYPYVAGNKPQVILITPPPIADDSVLIAKYRGGSERLKKLIPVFEEIAKKYGCQFADIYHPLINNFMSLTKDGIHLNEKGYVEAAKIINNTLDKNQNSQ